MSIVLKIAHKTRHQGGLTLIESLVALVVLALGILGLAGVQTRLLAESRTTNQRAIAIALIDDMSNRILLNRNSAFPSPPANSSYLLAWGANPGAVDCVTVVCNGAQLAQSDINIWKNAVTTALSGGNATIFTSPTDTRQIGIAIGWQSNESSSQDSNVATFNAPFAITAIANGTNCPANLICHIVYVQP